MTQAGNSAGADGAPDTEGNKPTSPELPLDEARSALERIDLVNVVPTTIHGEAHENPKACRDVRYEVDVHLSVAPGFFGNRFRYRIELLDDEEEPTATLDFELQVDYEVEEDFEPSREVAEYLTRTTGLFAAYPYARELAQTLTTRLQQDPLVLGLMPRGAVGPARVSGGGRDRPAASDR